MTPPDATPEIEITRKKFIGSGGALAVGAVAAATAYLGSERRAEASGTIPAYLDDNGASNETFQAAYSQTFSGKAIFKNGDPWFDVRAFGATGNGTTDDTTAIGNAIAAAVSTSGTGATGNATVYFPPGTYFIGSSGLGAAANSSNFTLQGAGFRSSILLWGTSPAYGGALLTLYSPSGVVIRDLGFSAVPQSNVVLAAISIGQGASSPPPTGVLIERVCIGDPNQSASSMLFAEGIYYTTTSYNDSATFRDVSISNCQVGYWFNGTSALRHIIEGGSVQNCSNAAVYTYPSGASTTGSFTVVGTRFSGNLFTCYIGQSASNETNNFLGIQAGFPGTPEGALISTATNLTDQSTLFVGGHGIGSVMEGHAIVDYQATQGTLEFHGFRAYSSNSINWLFYGTTGTGRINFYGGLLSSSAFNYNGTLQFHGTHHDPSASVSFTPTSGSSTARLLGFGYQNHLIGATSAIPSGNISLQSAAGTGGPTPTVTGGDLGGYISLTPGSSPGIGTLLEVTLVTPMPSGAAKIMLSPGNQAAAQVMNKIYTSGNTTSVFFLCTTSALTTGTNYVWNYAILG